MTESLEFPEPDDEGFLPERINEEKIRDPFVVAAALRGKEIQNVLGRRAVDLAYDWNYTMIVYHQVFLIVKQYLSS